MDYRLPDLGEGIHEAELAEWHVEPGGTVRHGETLAEVMTDKAVVELPAPFDGTVSELLIEPGETVAVGTPILRYTSEEAATEPASNEPPPLNEESATEQAEVAAEPEAGHNGSERGRPAALPRADVAAAPAVRRLARSLGIDLADIEGSGPGGRVLVDDLAGQVQSSAAESPETVRKRVESEAPAAQFGQPGTRIPFRGIRRKIAERMVHAKRTIPHIAYVDECDVTEMVRLRGGLRETLAKDGIHLTYLSFFVRAVVGALQEVPLLNASLDEEAGEIVLHDRYHIGIATSTPQGLVVPVLRDADRLDLRETARRIEHLSAAARKQQLGADDLRGSTFTITSIGGIGGLISTPIVNHPEVGILGIGRIVKRPVYDDAGALRPAEMVYLSFSFDHRVIDGAVGAAFGNAVIRRLENPAPLLLRSECNTTNGATE